MREAKFISENFLLRTQTAQRLYRQFAETEPIFDYHCHLSPADIACHRRFRNLFEIWLEGDHYKWRAMRANGIAEKFCTGDAEPVEKFRAWAATVPHTLRNPLYHWTHLELARYFGIDELLNERTAGSIWDAANEKLCRPEFTARGILKKFKVAAICTTDDPVDDLAPHQILAAEKLPTRVLPAFRPDRALEVAKPEAFNKWIALLEKTANRDIASFQDFVAALRRRHDDFHALGCRVSDHGLSQCLAAPCGDNTASDIFDRARRSQPASASEAQQFGACMMLHFGRWDAERGWVKQLHLGAMRNTNTRLLAKIGADAGFDSIGDFPQAEALAGYLNLLDREGSLPKTIIYNNNPADNYVFAAMIGNFQDSSIAGKVQIGPGWWFLDQKEGIEWQLNALSNLGLLSRFVGMVTDSRSFMSYPRHEYFRRIICNLIGSEVERGELPNDDELLGGMIRNICYRNARDYFAIPS